MMRLTDLRAGASQAFNFIKQHKRLTAAVACVGLGAVASVFAYQAANQAVRDGAAEGIARSLKSIDAERYSVTQLNRQQPILFQNTATQATGHFIVMNEAKAQAGQRCLVVDAEGGDVNGLFDKPKIDKEGNKHYYTRLVTVCMAKTPRVP